MLMATYPKTFPSAAGEALAGLTGRALAARKRELAVFFQVSLGTLSRWLIEIGIRAHRRSDAGSRRVDVAHYKTVRAIQVSSHKQQTGVLMPTEVAIEIAEKNNLVPAGSVQESSYNAWLREQDASRRQAEQPEPHIELRTDGPNHVHQADFSLAINWKIENNQAIYQELVYKNKLPAQGTLRLLRFVLTDHCSGAFFVWYVAATGESTDHLIEGLFRAWVEKEVAGKSVRAVYPFRGVPQILFLDRGPGTKTDHLKNFLAAFNVTLNVCEGSRSKGSVENMHWQWEQRFESRFRAQPPVSIEQLNDEAIQYAAHMCSTMIHTRHGRTRTACWEWFAGRKADLPIRVPRCDLDVARQLATSEPKECTVNGAGIVSFKSRKYRVPSPLIGQRKVVAQFDPFNFPSIYVSGMDGQTASFIVEPLEFDEFGYPADSVKVGEFQSHKRTDRAVAQDEAKEQFRVLAAASPIVTRGYHLEGLTASGIQSPETEISVAEPAPRYYELIRARQEVIHRMGYDLNPAEREVFAGWGEAVSEQQIEEACNKLRYGMTAKVIPFAAG
jgi:hypothetical protein